MKPIKGKGRWAEWIDQQHGGTLYADEVKDDHGNEMFEIFTTNKGGTLLQRINPIVFRQRYEYKELVNDSSNALSHSTKRKRR